MAEFWLDANVFMQAKNLYYAFDIAPGFWNHIVTCANSRRICSPMMVYNEIAKGGDDLAKWANGIKSLDLFVDPSKADQAAFQKVATWVAASKIFPQAQIAQFMSGADPWVVALAMARCGTVVTHERLVGPDSKKIKIPNVCKEFGVEYVDCYEMLRKLGLKLN